MAEAAAQVRVTIVFSPRPREVLERTLVLPAGTTMRQAVAASGLPAACPELDLRQVVASVWGSKHGWDQPLRDADRVELCRPLRVDPKVARRERFRAQGSRAAGLFANRRPGAKPGY